MKILVICVLLGLVLSATSHRRRGGGGRHGGMRGSNICSTYSGNAADIRACKVALRTCFGRGRRGKNRRTRPSASEREESENAVRVCLADYTELNIPNKFYRRGRFNKLGFLNGLNTTAERTIRCCIGEATTDYTSTGTLDREKIKTKLTAKISDASVLGYLIAGVNNCPEPTDCITKPFKECYIKACVDDVFQPNQM